MELDELVVAVKEHKKTGEKKYPPAINAAVCTLVRSGTTQTEVCERTGLSAGFVNRAIARRSEQAKKAASTRTNKKKARGATAVAVTPGMMLAEIQYNDGPIARISGSPDDIHRLLSQLNSPN